MNVKNILLAACAVASIQSFCMEEEIQEISLKENSLENKIQINANVHEYGVTCGAYKLCPKLDKKRYCNDDRAVGAGLNFACAGLQVVIRLALAPCLASIEDESYCHAVKFIFTGGNDCSNSVNAVNTACGWVWTSGTIAQCALGLCVVSPCYDTYYGCRCCEKIKNNEKLHTDSIDLEEKK